MPDYRVHYKSKNNWLDGVSEALCMLPTPASVLSPLRHRGSTLALYACLGLPALALLSVAGSDCRIVRLSFQPLLLDYSHEVDTLLVFDA